MTTGFRGEQQRTYKANTCIHKLHMCTHHSNFIQCHQPTKLSTHSSSKFRDRRNVAGGKDVSKLSAKLLEVHKHIREHSKYQGCVELVLIRFQKSILKSDEPFDWDRDQGD